MDFVENSLTLHNGSHVFGLPIYAHFSSAVIKASLHLLAVAVWNTVSVILHDSVYAVAHSKILQLNEHTYWFGANVGTSSLLAQYQVEI